MGKRKSWATGGSKGSRIAPVAAGLVAVAGGVLLAMPAVAQIASTKHNLGTNGTGVNKFSGTAEICVFCHTPHGADTSAAVPLWNRVLPAANLFTTYDSLGTSTLDGRTAPVGSVSIACLSCHDGQTAMQTVINQPGSGGYNTAGSAMAGSWTGANQTGGTLGVANQITNIGRDLRNDHPIGIQYGGGGITNASPTAATKDPDFVAPNNAVLGSTRVWWVDTSGGSANRDKTDMILYSRSDTTGADSQAISGGLQPYVECASCHDPHTTQSTFLRISNANSAVCLACHVK